MTCRIATRASLRRQRSSMRSTALPSASRARVPPARREHERPGRRVAGQRAATIELLERRVAAGRERVNSPADAAAAELEAARRRAGARTAIDCGRT